MDSVDIGAESAVPELVDALWDSKPAVRRAAAEALRALPAPAASATPRQLVARVCGPDETASKRAVWRLGRLGDAAVPAVVYAVGTAGALESQRLVIALGLTRSLRAGPALWRGMVWGNEILRKSYAYALEILLTAPPTRETIPLLLAVLEAPASEPDVAVQAARALETLAREAPCPELRHALLPLRRHLLHRGGAEFTAAWKAVEAATSAWRDLPLPAAPPLSDGTDLPRISEAPVAD